jgi:hypothetical protein
MKKSIIFLVFFINLTSCQYEIDQITGTDKRNKEKCKQTKLAYYLAIDNYCRSKGYPESYLPGCFSTFAISAFAESCN